MRYFDILMNKQNKTKTSHYDMYNVTTSFHCLGPTKKELLVFLEPIISDSIIMLQSRARRLIIIENRLFPPK